MNTHSRRLVLSAAMFGLIPLAACDDLGTSPSGTPRVSLSFATANAPAAAMSAMLLADPSGKTLDLQRVTLLLEEAELKRLNHDQCEDRDDACEKFSSGWRLIDLPLEGGLVTPFTEPIEPGTYEELELEIDQPEDDDGSRARFRAENPEWPRKATVRLTGAFDAGSGAGPQPFDLFLEVDAEVEQRFATPLVIDAGTDPQSVNVTVQVDVDSWLRGRNGALIDPASLAADSELRELVAENVEQSFEVFEDDDRDGRREGRDGGEDDEDDEDDEDRSGRGGSDDAPGDDHGEDD